MKKIWIFLMVTFLLILQGCSSLNSKVVAVDSYSTVPVPGGTYYLSSETKDLELQQEAFAMNLSEMLAAKGYARVYNKKAAQYNIVFNYSSTGPLTSMQSYQVPVNPWWSSGPDMYGGIYDGYFGPQWVNSVEATTYFVKKLEVSAYSANGKPVWQVVGTMKSFNSEIRGSFDYLVSGISPFVNRSSNQIVYVDVSQDQATGTLVPTVSDY
ncbi:MAG: hypothetical protein RR191_01525 [Cetobacterium sp.]|uniref:hypothetical protein n=1 Tax=unclassified Cetobacterium TaxID=2630983 RepID=UPI00163C9711|nr:hypothetical protein [Cetobacterium sp. 2A]MBC2855728.1 hypothetical protein [Cetobacterium sp. 2A]